MFRRLTRSRKFRKLIYVLAGSASAGLLGGTAFWCQVKQFHKNLSLHGFDAEDHKRQQQSQLYIWEEDQEHIHHIHSYLFGLEAVTAWIEARTGSIKRLIELTKSDNPSVRNIAVKILAENKDWTDVEFERVAKLCNNKTIVGLARMRDVDSRLFLPPPDLEFTDEILEDQFRQLLSQLPVHDVDKCTRYFTSSALVEGKTPSEERGGMWCFGGNGLAFAESISPVAEEIVELFCVQALLRHTRDMIWSFDGNGYAMAKTAQLLPSDFRLELFSLHALFMHSKILGHCPEIVKLGGLTLLRRICDSRKHSIKVMRNAARIIANLSICQQLHPAIVKHGWVSVLREWMASQDLALSLNASKALANMDRDFNERKYHDGVYLYHPQYRSSDPVMVDVVFVHGLLGGPFRTWRQRDPAKQNSTQNTQTNSLPLQPAKALVPSVSADTTTTPYTFCWPKDWLAKDLPNVRILTVEYETHLSEWAPKCPFESEKRSLSVRSKDMLIKLRRAGVGDRPIIWVGHSMGGLLIKKMLTLADDDPSLSEIVDKTHGIVLYSVPHRGSALAGYSKQTKFLLYPSIEVKELAPGSEMLKRLHASFTNIMFDRGIPLLSFGEGKKTELPLSLKQTLVAQESSDPGFGEYHLMEGLNHLEICKPKDKFDPVYTLTLEFMLDCLPHKLIQHALHAQGVDDYILEVLAP